MVELKRPEWSPTDLLFYALVRENGVQDHQLDLLQREIDWPYFLQLCRQHRVENIVNQNLKRNNLLTVPADVKSTLQENGKSLTLRALAQATEVRRVSTLFRSCDINLILTKGEAVSHRYYDLAYTRQSKDIDLWVDKGSVVRAESLLLELGYHKTSSNLNVEQGRKSAIYSVRNNSVFFHKGRKSQIELHWRLFKNDSLLNYSFSDEFQQADRFQIGDDAIRSMRTPQQLIYLACHGAVHFWHRLKWLADIERIVSRMSDDDMKRAHALAKEQQVEEILDTALALSTIVFSNSPQTQQLDRPVSTSVLKNTSHLLGNIHQSKEMELRGLADVGDVYREFLANIRIKSTLAYKLRYIGQFCISETDIERFKLGRNWLPFYHAIGPITRAWGAIGKNTDRDK